MTPLVLTHGDQRRLAAVTEALLSPLAYPDADAWRRAVCDHARCLLGADKLLFLLPQDGQVDLYVDGHDPEALGYPDWIEPVAEELDLFERYRALGSCTRAMLYEGHLDALYRSSYYNDYLLKHRAFDSLTLSVPVGGEPKPRLAHYVQFIGNTDSPHKPPFGDREVVIGRLLLPALQTGALTWLRLARARHALAAMVDGLAVGALVYDADGRELHRNPAAMRLLTSEAVARGLATLAGQMARGLTRPAHLLDPTPPPAVARAGRFVLRATHLGPDAAGRDDAVLVTIEATDPVAGAASEAVMDAEAEAALRERCGLTRQQARVALLLAARRSTDEIAGALFVSPHTVRRHVEQVLDRLGVPRRADVEAAVRQALGCPAGVG